MTAREIYESIRTRRQDRPSLRLWLILLVSAELLAAVLIAVGIYFLLERWVPMSPSLLLVLDLVVVTLIISTVVTSFVAKYIFSPIKNLQKGMEKVAQGDYSVQLNVSTPFNEIKEVNSGFNLMVSALQGTEILQTDFVSNVSHEFKTPITAIEGYSMLLQDDGNLTEAQKEYVQKIVFNSQRLSSLVGSILLLSRLENQAIPTGKTTYRLDEQIRQSIVALEPAWEQQETEFDIEMEEISYTGNEGMLWHVWDNLIGNAIKFGPKGGVLTVRLWQRNGRVICTVADQGPGLNEETRKHMFDKFYQGDSSHKQEGNGLGLPLVKQILSLSDGEIAAENLPEGGCRFTVTL